MEFKTEVNQLLNLMIHSLYSNKEIFLRELISNSSDAIDKLNFLSLSDDKYKGISFSPSIKISVNKDAKLLIIEDNGIGMDEADLNNNLGTIASSGTKKFLENLSDDAKKNSDLIGQFGVGFYSAFMVASKIEVYTKKALCNESFLWSSDTNGYEISKTNKENIGTKIVLHLKDDEFLDTYKIESLVSKYSNHISYPIFLEKEVSVGEGDDKKTELKFEQINKAKALWRENKASLKKEDYLKFYEGISYDSKEPLLYVHTKSEGGSLEYSSLFFIPASAPHDLYRVDYEKGIKLYVKRVLISEKEEILPTYLRFVKGVLDVEDLPLNVSREILQENVILKKIKEISTKKILNELEKLQKNDAKKYNEFYKLFGAVLKEALFDPSANKDEILTLCKFDNSQNDKQITLEEYCANLGENKTIYYLIGENKELLKHSPLLESYKKNGINVLLLSDKIDPIVMPMVHKYKDYDLKAINEVSEIKKDDLNEEQKSFCEKLSEILKSDVKEVVLSNSLESSLSSLVYDSNDQEYMMAKMMAQFSGEKMNAKGVLQLNAKHELVEKLISNNDDEKLKDLAYLAYGTAALAQGLEFAKVAEFNEAVINLAKKAF